MNDYWQRQTVDKPLFPDTLWERPERKDQAGKLLIIGGSSQGFRAPAESYDVAVEAGIGECHILMPESLSKLTKGVSHIAYAEANDIGGFSVKARDALLQAAQWSGGVLLAGDYGRNSEAAILLAEFLQNYGSELVLTKDAIDILYPETKHLLNRPKTLLIVNFGQLQRLAKEAGELKAFTSDMDFMVFVARLHEFTTKHSAAIVTKHHNQLIAAWAGHVISTERSDLDELWQIYVASRAVTFQLHHPGKKLEALASALL